MIEFWIAALALGLVAAAVVLVPALRVWTRSAEGRTGTTLGIAVVLAMVVPVSALVLYARWTTWDWSGDAARASAAEAEEMHAMDDAVGALLARLQRDPNDVEGWSMLGRTYMQMRRFGDAAGAYRQALDVAAGEPLDLLADLGQAMALSDPQGLQGGAGPMFERVLELNPDDPNGLWYGGIYAYENRDFAVADERLSKLLTMNPPPTLIPLIEERIAEARAHADVDPAMFADAGQGTPPAQETGSVQAAEQPAPAPAGDGIPIQVTLDPGLAGRLNRPAPLFIIARNPAGGPPLAVIRRMSGQLPVSVELRDENAMMQGMTILDQPELDLVARVSLSGSPAAQPGDLFGEITYAQGGGPVQINIDRVVE
jgi:cytochrome c-type biogenesis protein CcmH